MNEEGTTSRVNRQRLRPALIIAAALVITGVLLTGFGRPGFLIKQELDVTAVDTGVQRVLTDSYGGYGLTDVADVHCNRGKNPTIKAKATFDCDATVAGTRAVVTVTLVGDDGAYWVDPPR